jgi:hypothetical protein
MTTNASLPAKSLQGCALPQNSLLSPEQNLNTTFRRRHRGAIEPSIQDLLSVNHPAPCYRQNPLTMASLPTEYPNLSLHLTDPALTLLISSSSSHQRRQSTSSSPFLLPTSHSPRYAALTDLTTASLTAYSSAARLGLGLPQRIIIDTTKRGPVILHSFLNPEIPQPKTKAEGAATSVAADAKAIVDQTREQLRPLSGSTVEEEARGLDEGVVGESVVHDGIAGGEGEGSDVTLAANGQSRTDSLDRGVGVRDDMAQADEDEGKLAPLLIATVVAPSHDKEANRAMGRLEKLGVEFQKRWVEQQVAQREAADAAEREQEEEENADG